jgi:AraC-like DNA-binding protein
VLQTTHFLNIKIFSNDAQFSFFLNCAAFSYLALNSTLVLFPQILYGLPNYNLLVERNAIDSASNLTNLNAPNPAVIIENRKALNGAFLTMNYELEIKKALQNWRAEKKYLEENASLLSISTFTTIPVHHLSYYFNSLLKIKYTDWRNTLRIDYAKNQIDSGECKKITLEALSTKSGFATQATFIKSFKNDVGCTPSEYIKTKTY